MSITDIPTSDTTDPTATEEFVEKVFAAVLGAQEVQAMFLGDRLGWYDVLAERAVTAAELSEATRTDARYAREWLEHQTVTGYARCDDPGAAPDDRRYRLDPAQAEVLTDVDSLAFVAPLGHLTVALGKHIDAVADAYRTGGGVSWDQLGDDARAAQAAANRPMFLRQLGAEYLRSVPEVHERLREGGRVADIGAGYGWSSIGVAQAYPAVEVDAFDIDGPSITEAKANIEAAGLGDRVQARQVDAATVVGERTYDLVLALECIHDLPDPVGVLTTMRRLAGDDGTVIVMDENVGDVFTGEPDDVERLMYGFSLMCCLPDGRAHDHSVATGTVMRPSTFEAYAREAGFEGAEILPIENDFFRFYRLH